MTDLSITQGDSFPPDHPLRTYTALDGNGDPLDLSGREFRATFRPAPVSMATDATDTGSDVAITGTLIVDGTGTATTQDRLYLVDAAAGTMALVLTSEETSGVSVPLDTPLKSDIQMTVRNYWGAGNDLVRTVTLVETLTVTAGYTNRLTG